MAPAVDTSTCKPGMLLNLTLPKDTEAVLYDMFDIIIVTIVMPCIMVVGHIGNSAFLFVMFRVKSMRTVTNFYLTHLALSDILFLSLAVGEKLWRYHSSPVTFDQSGMSTSGCSLFYLFLNTAFFASLFLVTLVSLEKYCRVCQPLKYLKLAGKKRTVTLITVAWVVALSFSACIIPGSGVMRTKCVQWADLAIYDDLPELVGMCSEVNEVWGITFQGLQTIPFLACSIINKVLYTKIILKLHRRATQNPALSRHGTSSYANHIRQRNQMAHMLIATGILFTLCLTPFQVLSFLNMISNAANDTNIIKNQQVDAIVTSLCRVLVYLNSAINPIVYNATNAR